MHSSTSATVANVSALDTVRKRIDLCIRSLNEAEKLLTFSSSIDQLFQSTDYLKIAETLEGVKQSLSVLSDIPEFREQAKHFQQHQDRLEQLIRPQLTAALTQRDLEACKNYLRVFQSIKREQQYMSHYYNVRLEPIRQLWASFGGGARNVTPPKPPAGSPGTSSPPNINQTTPTANLNQWIQTFYEEVTLLAHTELDWLVRLSPTNSAQLTEQMLVSLFLSINTQLHTRIEQFVPPSQPGKTGELITLYQTTIQFLKQLKLPEKNTLIKTVLEPFKHFQTKYPENEGKLFRQYLSSFTLVKKNDYMTTIKNVENSINKLFPLCEASIDRLYELTHATEIEPYVQMLNNVFRDFITMLKETLNELKVMSNIAVPKDILMQIEQRRQQAMPGAKPPAQQVLQPAQLNWEYFQGAMKLLQDIAVFMNRLRSFEQSIQSNFISYLSSMDEMDSLKIILHDITKLHKVQNIVHQISSLSLPTATVTTTPKKSLLQDAYDQVVGFCAQCQNYVFETMIHYIRQRFKDMPKMAEWKQQGGGESYQTNPSQVSYSTQIAEHLLNIPQQLDPYSEDELYRFSYHVAMTYPVNDDFYQNLVKQLHQQQVERRIQMSMMSDDEASPAKQEHHSETEDENIDEMDGIAHQWMTLVASATEKLYLQSIVEISMLSEFGCQQLSNDIGYLFNVLSALGVSADPLLSRTQQLVSTPKERYAEIISNIMKSDNNAEKNIANLIAKMRGIKL
ncbi:hypothetical protein SAMD00019534_008720 [Acytostelium subglobosum LB1]|uniref:hypothetical protein n=1 Tax=Acytostelium subglobosum LB1 TaxID=1410327 RepID=UPI00064489F9|nr:hypothetical protein SAMD00019534_008720 [Acytostelium subglobosum LB1]GAM17697.1 hypothetical protein SAMD00019534_008720 [Acytostelium subglobosum LB1]|eukprot:XP_012758293.1 hypothetical protein SAMD00019534_008720 [Acytostelium subglobosum LB1]